MTIRLPSVRLSLTLIGSLLLCSQAWSQSASSTYSPPRTVNGKPDLQGTWSNASITTLERNSRYENLVLSDDEAIQATNSHPQNVRLATDDNLQQGELLDGSDLGRGRGYNAFWIDPGTSFGVIDGQVRTSWITQPEDGRIPYNQQGREARAALALKISSFDGPETRPLAERCIGTNNRIGPPMINGLYNNYYQIIQTEDYVVVRTEMISHARIIPLDSQHIKGAIQPLFGESIGYWEGDTLVVETTNFSPWQVETSVSLSPQGKVTERFTRVSDSQILYQFSIDDTQYYEQVWHGELNFNAVDVQVYEFACHEGNYALPGILAGARVQEKDAL